MKDLPQHLFPAGPLPEGLIRETKGTHRDLSLAVLFLTNAGRVGKEKALPFIFSLKIQTGRVQPGTAGPGQVAGKRIGHFFRAVHPDLQQLLQRRKDLLSSFARPHKQTAACLYPVSQALYLLPGKSRQIKGIDQHTGERAQLFFICRKVVSLKTDQADCRHLPANLQIQVIHIFQIGVLV